MGKSTPKPPPAPDPVKVAAAQTVSNKETARTEATLNRVNQYTPWGNVTFSDLGNDRWSQNVSLSPEEQRTYDLKKQMENGGLAFGSNLLGQVGSQFANQMDTSGLTPINTNFGAERQRLTDTVYNQARGFLDPQFETGQRQLETKLANQGITQGSEAYTRAIADFERNKAGAYQQAMNSAILQGSNEANTLFGQNMGARQQGLNELEAQRARPMNELSALMNMSSVQAPQYGQAANVGVAPTDVIGAHNMAYQGQMNAYNAQLQSQQSQSSGLMSMVGALGMGAMMMSDRRVKDDIKRVGTLDNGLPVYTFRYKGDDRVQMGVMAQDVLDVKPEAVEMRNGILHVDYARIGG